MGADACWPLQKAIIAALEADSTVRRLLGGLGRVGANAHNLEPPAIIYAGSETRAWHSATFDGQDHEVVLALRTPPQGPEAAELAEAVTGVLHDADLPLPGHALISLEFERSESRRESETGQGACRMIFKALTVSD